MPQIVRGVLGCLFFFLRMLLRIRTRAEAGEVGHSPFCLLYTFTQSLGSAGCMAGGAAYCLCLAVQVGLSTAQTAPVGMQATARTGWQWQTGRPGRPASERVAVAQATQSGEWKAGSSRWAGTLQ